MRLHVAAQSVLLCLRSSSNLLFFIPSFTSSPYSSFLPSGGGPDGSGGCSSGGCCGRDSRSRHQLCGSARRRAGETGAGPACSGHTVSSWQGRSWELFTGKRMGGSASHRRAHTHTDTRTPTRTHSAYQQCRTTFVCLPPIRSLCFLSPHSERCCSSPSFPQNARR